MLTMREVRNYWLFLLFVLGAGLLVLADVGCGGAGWQEGTRNTLLGAHQTGEVVGKTAEDGYKTRCGPLAAKCAVDKTPGCPALQECHAKLDGVVSKVDLLEKAVAAGLLGLLVGDDKQTSSARLAIVLQLARELSDLAKALGLFK